MKVKVFQILIAACILAGVNSSVGAHPNSARNTETGYNHPGAEEVADKESIIPTHSNVPDLAPAVAVSAAAAHERKENQSSES